MIRAVIFDFDGVLVESVDIKTRAFAKLFEPEGPAVMKAVTDYHIENAGVSRFDKFRYIYKTILKQELSEEKFSELCSRFSDLVKKEVVAAPYVKGAKEFLEKSVASYKFFIASGTPQAEIEDIVRLRGIGRYFSGIYGSPTRKSDAVKDICRSYDYPPEEILFIGDAMSDYEAAAENGSRFIARMNYNEGIFKGIDCVKVNDLSSLDEALKKMNR